MVDPSKEIVLSFSDIFHSIKRYKKHIICFSLLFGLLLFVKQLNRPVLYTAQGLFKCTTPPPQRGITELFNAVPSAGTLLDAPLTTQIEPKALISSRRLMEEVVKKLELQAEITEVIKQPRLHRLWRSLMNEYMHFYYTKLRKPLSSLLHPGQILVDEIELPTTAAPIHCSDLSFTEEFFVELHIFFDSQERFSVRDAQNRSLGEGKLNQPFSWKSTRFTLAGTPEAPLRQRHFVLTLLPFSEVATAFSKKVSVIPQKKTTSLLNISYTHSNRHLAAQVVNAIMERYLAFLKSEVERRAEQQLIYLEQRQVRTRGELDQLLWTHKALLESHIEKTGFPSFPEHTSFLVERQINYEKRLAETQLAIENLSASSLPLTDLEALSPLEGFDLEHIGALQKNYHTKMDQLEFKVQQCLALIEKMEQRDFSMAPLAPLLADPYLDRLFSTIYTIHLSLHDSGNWSSKEQERLHRELDIQRQYLLDHITQQKEIAELELTLLRQKSLGLKQKNLALLIEQRRQIESRLHEIKLQTRELPQLWLSEQKISFNTLLSTNLVENLTKMVEGKNINAHIAITDSSALVPAVAPALPNSLHLRLSLMAGSCLGALAAIIFLSLYAIFKGPSACIENLESLAYPTLGPLPQDLSSESAQRVLQQLPLPTFKQRVLLLQEQQPTGLLPLLLARLARKGEKILLINTNPEGQGQGLYSYLEGSLTIPPIQQLGLLASLQGGVAPLYFEELLDTQKFHLLMEQLKEEFRWIILYSVSGLKDRGLPYLLTHSQLILTTFSSVARLEEIEKFHHTLPSGLATYYIVQEPAAVEEFAYLTRWAARVKERLKALCAPLFYAVHLLLRILAHKNFFFFKK